MFPVSAYTIYKSLNYYLLGQYLTINCSLCLTYQSCLPRVVPPKCVYCTSCGLTGGLLGTLQLWRLSVLLTSYVFRSDRMAA